MQDITGSLIRLTKGDSFYSTIDIDNGSLSAGDVIRFSVRKDRRARTEIISKDIPRDTMQVYLAPEDTKNLDPGLYAYTFKVLYENGEADTFAKGTLKILPEG